MNYAKDEKLGWYSSLFKDAEFRTDLLEESKSRVADVEAAERHNRLRGVRIPPNTRGHLLVQAYIGGEMRTFATVPVDVFKAARIADLLTFKFGRFRLLRPRTLTEKDYNFSEAQARHDYESDEAMRGIVDDVERHLRSIGALSSDTPDPDSVPRSKRQAMGALSRRLERLETLVAEMHAKICATPAA